MGDFQSASEQQGPITSEETITELIEQYNLLFDDMTQKRHEIGRERYGDFAFLGNDVIRMTMEELADVSNYARYMFVKLGILNEYLQSRLKEEVPTDEEGNVTIGVKSFRGTKEGWGKRE